MSKESSSWYSDRLQRDLQVVRWGDVGRPVLIFPTAGGDAEECERFLMLDALSDLLEDGRIKVFSVDAIGTQAVLDEALSREQAARIQLSYMEALAREVVPAIRADCNSEDIEIIVAGASLGAFNALAALCRNPDVYSHAICMSGTYDLSRWMDGRVPEDWYHTSPLHFVPNLHDERHLESLRRRFVLVTHGTGRWESPRESWAVGDVLGAQGVPNRVDEWGDEWDHDWPTWRRMLPQYLDELVP